MGTIVAFHDTMAQFSNLTREEDKVVWKIGSKGVFSVKSAYKDLNHSNSNDRKELCPWQMIWKPKNSIQGKLFHMVTSKRSSADTREYKEEEVPTMLKMLFV